MEWMVHRKMHDAWLFQFSEEKIEKISVASLAMDDGESKLANPAVEKKFLQTRTYWRFMHGGQGGCGA